MKIQWVFNHHTIANRKRDVVTMHRYKYLITVALHVVYMYIPVCACVYAYMYQYNIIRGYKPGVI